MGGLSLEDLWRSQRKGSWEVSAQGIMGGLSLKNHWRSQRKESWEVSASGIIGGLFRKLCPVY